MKNDLSELSFNLSIYSSKVKAKQISKKIYKFHNFIPCTLTS
jgi:hypothetical protein